MPLAPLDPRVARSRAAVIRTAAEVLVEAGPAAVTVDAVVQRSGVARSTIYRHFPSSADVLRAAVDALIPDTPQVPARGDVAVLLEDFLVHLAEELRTSAWAQLLPGLLELVARDPGLEPHRAELVERHRAPLRELLHRAAADGLLPAGTDPDAAAARLVGPLFYRRMVSGEELSAALCRELLAGVLAPGPAAATPDGGGS
ncbi:AcrR family transcriptional regulator [Kineococcus xinjiangensis]|uniref:AcrR family transcriptional regulator n=1 Tax=Kineococcus xinjiangensis TaxID=512762 RepID=A0A2S6IDC0_9ACTN|nr:TetR/AcrR family transcriptional regulator [Kineococcus xinjiangensis]PPK92199.1 AcrR family transcriptional regulator [Kineococcus xinjiangensis]